MGKRMISSAMIVIGVGLAVYGFSDYTPQGVGACGCGPRMPPRTSSIMASAAPAQTP